MCGQLVSEGQIVGIPPTAIPTPAKKHHILMQVQGESDPPPAPQGTAGHIWQGATQAGKSGQVTAVDETTMKEEDLEEAVGLLTQLEARMHPESYALNLSCNQHPDPCLPSHKPRGSHHAFLSSSNEADACAETFANYLPPTEAGNRDPGGVQAYKRETLGQEALLREKEEALLMERKRRYGANSLPDPGNAMAPLVWHDDIMVLHTSWTHV